MAACLQPPGCPAAPHPYRAECGTLTRALFPKVCGLDLFAGSSFVMGSRARLSCAAAPQRTLPQPARSGVQHRRFKCHLRSPRYGDQACGALARREPGTKGGEGETPAFEWSFPRRGAGVQPRVLTAARSNERMPIGATVGNGPRASIVGKPVHALAQNRGGHHAVVPSSDSSFRAAGPGRGVMCGACLNGCRGGDGCVLRTLRAARRYRIRTKPKAASSRERSI